MLGLFLPSSSSNEVSVEHLREHVDTSHSETLLEEIDMGRVPTPKSIEELPQQDFFTSTLSLDVAAALGIPFGATDAKFSRRIFIQEYLKYADIEQDDQKVRWGVAVRWIVNYKTLNIQAKTTSLALVAASAQVGWVQAEARFQVKGADSLEISSAIPAPVTLNVDTYHEMNQAFKEIKRLIWNDETIITPILVSVYVLPRETIQDDFEEPLAISWALTQIKKARTLEQALDRSKRDHPRFGEVVKSIYITVSGTSERNAPVSAEAKERAAEILGGLNLKG